MRLLFGTGEGLGNIIQSTPALAALKKAGHEVHVLCTETSPNAHRVLSNKDIVDNIITDWNYSDISKYDKVASTDYCLGLRNKRVPRTKHNEKEWIYNLRVAQTLDPSVKIEPNFWANSGEPQIKKSEKSVMILPGCKQSFAIKRYPHFLKMAKILKEEGFNVSFCGNENEVKEYVGFEKHFSLDILEVGGLLRSSDFVISNDNGLMHYAGALGVKTYGIFGPSSRIKNLPPTVECISIDNIPETSGMKPECMPCQQTKPRDWTTNITCQHECLIPIKPKFILNKILGVKNGTDPR